MKKTLTILGAVLFVTVVMTSCGNSIESDAKKLADLQCKSLKAGTTDIAAATETAQLAEKLKDKYQGDDLKKFEEAFAKEFANCK